MMVNDFNIDIIGEPRNGVVRTSPHPLLRLMERFPTQVFRRDSQ